MIDHVTVRVQNLSQAVDFYRGALAPLRYDVVMEYPGAAGLGSDGKPDLWLMETDQPLNPTHLALTAERAVVDAFYQAALDAGGADNGAAGLRPDYHPHYYAAFVRDPEGNNIEVVCHADPDAKPARLVATRKAVRAPQAAARKSAPRKAASRKASAKAKKPAKPAARRAGAKKTSTTKTKAKTKSRR